MGLRFRLHRRDLPGSPDIVLPRHGAVVFVHGCYWHGHRKRGCSGGRLPKSNVEFWTAKIRGNAERDGRKVAALRRTGWRVLTVWECELRNAEGLERRLRRFFGEG